MTAFLTRIITYMRSTRLLLQKMLSEFLSIRDSARLDRVALDTTFNDTGRRNRELPLDQRQIKKNNQKYYENLDPLPSWVRV